jgi:hypothetical protein
MATIRLTTELEPSDLAADLLEAGGFDIIEFILHLDEQVADESFTLQLIQKLVGSISDENETYLRWLAERALEQNFGDGSKSSEETLPRHPVYMRNYAKEWEEEDDKRRKLKEIGKLVDSLA